MLKKFRDKIKPTKDDGKYTCSNCGKRVFDRELSYVGGREYCRYCK